MKAEYPEATWYPTPGFGFPNGAHGRGGFKPHWVILHGTASGDGTALQQARYFSTTKAHGVHFVIGKDGTVIQMVLLGDAAYGNGIIQSPHAPWWTSAVNPNLTTISIEHCKTHSDNSDALTPAQQEASFRLVKWLCQRFAIPMRQADGAGGITGHFSIEGIDRKDCPGTYPWAALWEYLKPAPVPAPAPTPTVSPPTPTPTPTGGPMDPNYKQTASDTLEANGQSVYGWIGSNILALLPHDHLTLILGLPTSGQHKDADERWRQSFTNVVASQSSTNEADFRLEPLPVNAELQAQVATASKDNAALQAQLTQAQAQIKTLQALPAGPVPAQLAALLDQFSAFAPQLSSVWSGVKAQQPRPNVTAPLPVLPHTPN